MSNCCSFLLALVAAVSLFANKPLIASVLGDEIGFNSNANALTNLDANPNANLSPLLPPSTTKTTTNNNHINYNSETNTENIAIGNTNTNNYNFQQSSYLPTQLTQVVLNVPKPKKLRISRPPTEEEFAIKRKILDVYDGARRDTQLQSINFDHLGRILQAINPKYVATERVRRVAFGDPRDPKTLVPLPDRQPQPLSTIQLEAKNDEKALIEQLDALIHHFKSHVQWELQFVNQLANTDESELNLEQLAFRRLLLCLTQSDLCPKPQGNGFIVQQQQQQQQQQAQNEQQKVAEMMDMQPEAVSATEQDQLFMRPQMQDFFPNQQQFQEFQPQPQFPPNVDQFQQSPIPSQYQDLRRPTISNELQQQDQFQQLPLQNQFQDFQPQQQFQSPQLQQQQQQQQLQSSEQQTRFQSEQAFPASNFQSQRPASQDFRGQQTQLASSNRQPFPFYNANQRQSPYQPRHPAAGVAASNQRSQSRYGSQKWRPQQSNNNSLQQGQLHSDSPFQRARNDGN